MITGALTGTFTPTSVNSTWTVGMHNQYESGVGGVSLNSVVVAAAGPIPEPSTYAALVGIAVLSLAVLRRRVKNKA